MLIKPKSSIAFLFHALLLCFAADFAVGEEDRHGKDPDELDADNPGWTHPPSKSPTAIPSFPPSPGPSLLPTKYPSVAPSIVPSLSPSFPPSTSPSESPTMKHSISPSSIQSSPPSSSTSPSLIPSLLLSTAPSARPSLVPTLLHTSSPSSSHSPSSTLSATPSTTPSLAPSTSPSEYCVDIVKEFGPEPNSSDYCSIIYYGYEIETVPNTTIEELESDIIPAVERAIADGILPLIVGECSKDDRVRRRLHAQNGGVLFTNRVRDLEIFAVSFYPEDFRPEQSDGECRFQSLNDTECSIVSGALSICTTDYETDKGRVLEAIKNGMSNDDYVDAHEDIVKITYISEDVDSVVNPGNILNPPVVRKDESRGLDPVYWAVIGGGTAAILAIVFAGRRLIGDEEDEEEGDDGGDDNDVVGPEAAEDEV